MGGKGSGRKKQAKYLSAEECAARSEKRQRLLANAAAAQPAHVTETPNPKPTDEHAYGLWSQILRMPARLAAAAVAGQGGAAQSPHAAAAGQGGAAQSPHAAAAGQGGAAQPPHAAAAGQGGAAQPPHAAATLDVINKAIYDKMHRIALNAASVGRGEMWISLAGPPTTSAPSFDALLVREGLIIDPLTHFGNDCCKCPKCSCTELRPNGWPSAIRWAWVYRDGLRQVPFLSRRLRCTRCPAQPMAYECVKEPWAWEIPIHITRRSAFDKTIVDQYIELTDNKTPERAFARSLKTAWRTTYFRTLRTFLALLERRRPGVALPPPPAPPEKYERHRVPVPGRGILDAIATRINVDNVTISELRIEGLTSKHLQVDHTFTLCKYIGDTTHTKPFLAYFKFMCALTGLRLAEYFMATTSVTEGTILGDVAERCPSLETLYNDNAAGQTETMNSQLKPKHGARRSAFHIIQLLVSSTTAGHILRSVFAASLSNTFFSPNLGDLARLRAMNGGRDLTKEQIRKARKSKKLRVHITQDGLEMAFQRLIDWWRRHGQDDDGVELFTETTIGIAERVALWIRNCEVADPEGVSMYRNMGTEENPHFLSIRDTCRLEGSNHHDHLRFQAGRTGPYKAHDRLMRGAAKWNDDRFVELGSYDYACYDYSMLTQAASSARRLGLSTVLDNFKIVSGTPRYNLGIKQLAVQYADARALAMEETADPDDVVDDDYDDDQEDDIAEDVVDDVRAQLALNATTRRQAQPPHVATTAAGAGGAAQPPHAATLATTGAGGAAQPLHAATQPGSAQRRGVPSTVSGVLGAVRSERARKAAFLQQPDEKNSTTVEFFSEIIARIQTLPSAPEFWTDVTVEWNKQCDDKGLAMTSPAFMRKFSDALKLRKDREKFIRDHRQIEDQPAFDGLRMRGAMLQGVAPRPDTQSLIGGSIGAAGGGGSSTRPPAHPYPPPAQPAPIKNTARGGPGKQKMCIACRRKGIEVQATYEHKQNCPNKQ